MKGEVHFLPFKSFSLSRAQQADKRRRATSDEHKKRRSTTRPELFGDTETGPRRRRGDAGWVCCSCFWTDALLIGPR